MVEPAEAVVRLVIVFLLAFGIGLERQLRRKPVGFGTFVFVSTGACALAILSVDLEDQNPLPLLGGVITGIGFLGAGALSVRTTGSSASRPRPLSGRWRPSAWP